VDWEMIIVNDGSTDETAAIASRHAAEDRRIRIIHQDNAGQAAANNRAVPEARAEYIARMDADDIAFPERLAVLASYLNEHPKVVVIGTNVVFLTPDGRELQHTRLPETDGAIRAALFSRQENAFCNPSLMFRKSAWIACGGERSCFGHAHDLDLCLRLVEQGEARNLQRQTIGYRIHSGQVSTTATELQATCALAAFLCAAARMRGDEELGYTARAVPISRKTLNAANVSNANIDETVLSNIVGMHERLCMLGDLGAAYSLRQDAVSRYAQSSAKTRLAAAQCVMLYHEGRAAPSPTRRLAAWAAGARHLPAAFPWLCYRFHRVATRTRKTFCSLAIRQKPT